MSEIEKEAENDAEVFFIDFKNETIVSIVSLILLLILTVVLGLIKLPINEHEKQRMKIIITILLSCAWGLQLGSQVTKLHLYIRRKKKEEEGKV